MTATFPKRFERRSSRLSPQPKIKHEVQPHTSGVLVMAPEVPALIPGRVTLLVGCASDELGAEVTVAAREERRA